MKMNELFELSGNLYDIEAEQSVLGAILIDKGAIGRVMDFLSAECFYKDENRELFSIMVTMFGESEAIDAITVASAAENNKVFASQQDARAYIALLVEKVPSAGNVESYAKIVQEKYFLRCLQNVAGDIMDSSSEGNDGAAQLLDAAEQKIYEIRKGTEKKGLVHFRKIVVDLMDQLQRLSGDERDKYAALSSGFSDLDRKILGLNKGDLIILAARPAMGKTSLALNIATNVAKSSDKAVAVFSLEMPDEQVVMRMISSEAQIIGQNLRTGELEADDWKRLSQAGVLLAKRNIFIDDSSNITVPEMKARLRRIDNLGLVVVDYLQLMSSSGRNENRVQAVSEMTRNLKILAKDLEVPVICLSQLSRDVEKRQGKPMLSDLRESGSIEQDADIVLFLHREYKKDEEAEDDKSYADCIIAKNRHGDTGDIRLGFDGRFTKFTSYEGRYDEY